MEPPRLLLLSATLPGGQEAGGIILRDLLSRYPADAAAAFIVDAFSRGDGRPDPPTLRCAVRPMPFRAARASARRGPATLLTAGRFAWARAVSGAALRRAAVALGREHGATLCWAVLDQPLMYRLARVVAAELGVPLVVTVWDPPESVGLNARLDGISQRRAVRDFDETLRVARRAAVISETMAETYGRSYGVETVIVRHGLDATLFQSPPPQCAERTLTIGFCGSLYALDEWRALLRALHTANWTIAGRAVRVRVLSGGIDLRGGEPACIEWLGWRPVHETVRRLAECDVNYLPYWFAPERRTAVRLCFPTKLSTYLATGRPVLFHGPADASVPRFFARYPAGYCVDTLAPEGILDALTRIATDESAYTRAVAAVAAARREELSMETFHARFQQFIGSAPA